MKDIATLYTMYLSVMDGSHDTFDKRYQTEWLDKTTLEERKALSDFCSRRSVEPHELPVQMIVLRPHVRDANFIVNSDGTSIRWQAEFAIGAPDDYHFMMRSRGATPEAAIEAGLDILYMTFNDGRMERALEEIHSLAKENCPSEYEITRKTKTQE